MERVVGSVAAGAPRAAGRRPHGPARDSDSRSSAHERRPRSPPHAGVGRADRLRRARRGLPAGGLVRPGGGVRRRRRRAQHPGRALLVGRRGRGAGALGPDRGGPGRARRVARAPGAGRRRRSRDRGQGARDSSRAPGASCSRSSRSGCCASPCTRSRWRRIGGSPPRTRRAPAEPLAPRSWRAREASGGVRSPARAGACRPECPAWTECSPAACSRARSTC